MIYITRPDERYIINQGKFIIRLIRPGLKLNNPNDYGIGALGRVDHSTLEPGALIPMHPHKNDEILSYMRRGTMDHKDTHKNKVPIHNTFMMMMNSGSGIMHEEGVSSASKERVEMLQIFARPKSDDLEPKIDFYKFESANSNNEWRLVGGPEHSEAPLKIRSEVLLYDVHLDNFTIETPELNGLTGFLYIFEGKVNINQDTVLEKGSSVVVKDEKLQLQSDGVSDLVFFILDEESTYSRSGLYSG